MLNNVVLIGRLVDFPELKKTANGVSVSTIRIAVDRRFKGNNGEKITDFLNCVAWRGTADFICKYFKKGDLIALTGEIQTRKYEDKNGNKRTAVEVVINDASFCGGKNDNNADFTVINETDIDDELPF